MKDRLPELRLAESSASDEDDDSQRNFATERRSGRKKLRKPRSWKRLMKRRVRKSGGKSWDSGTSDTEVDLKPGHMKAFFSTVQSIKEDTEAIKKATKAIGEINEASLLATTTEEENECSHRLESLVDETNKCAKRAKTLLDLLKEENKRLADEEQAKASDLRVRENLCGSLTRKFISEVRQYQNTQNKYKASIKNKVKRQVKTIKPDATDEEIDQVLSSKGGRDELYQKLILEGRINDQVYKAYSKIRGKYQDILTLEQSISELHKMFLDFSLLTEEQGEILDQIEFQVELTGDSIEDGNVNMYEAVEYQRKIRKRQCRLLLIVAIVATVVAVIVLF